MIERSDITGLVLAGGRGRRMGGVDKGLQLFRGQALARHALQRLTPQVGPLMLSANRHLAAYQAMGVPVHADALPDYPGPLAGFLAGLQHCATPYLVTVPCDSPGFPDTLVASLAHALWSAQAEIAMAVTGPHDAPQPQPAFCLMHVSVADSLLRFLQSGQGSIAAWVSGHQRVEVYFNDSDAFSNANTIDELHRLQ